MHFAILKVQKVKSRADLLSLTKHGRRTDASPHVDRSRSHLNRHWAPAELGLADPADLVAAVDAVARRAGAVVRKGAPVAADFHLGASPEYFERNDGTWDMAKVTRWAEANRRVMLRRFPNMVASMRVDLDESSPHMAVYLVPIYQKQTKHRSSTAVSFRKVFGGETKEEVSRKMVDLQDWYAGALAPLGLARGISRAATHRVGLTHHQYRLARAREDAERIKATTELELERRALATELAALQQHRQAVADEWVRLEQFRSHVQSIGDLYEMFAEPTADRNIPLAPNNVARGHEEPLGLDQDWPSAQRPMAP